MPSITRTRANPVPRSRITRPDGRRAASPIRLLWLARGGRRRARYPGSRSGGCRRHPGRSRPTVEEAEEIAFGRQHEGGIAPIERVAIGLQRAIKCEELLVLPEGV